MADAGFAGAARAEPGRCGVGHAAADAGALFGGGYDLPNIYGDTWEWTQSGGWRQFNGASPSPRDHTQMAFDIARGKAVLFGGGGQDPSVAFGDTWEYDGTAWTQVATTGPAPRVHHAMQCWSRSRDPPNSSRTRPLLTFTTRSKPPLPVPPLPNQQETGRPRSGYVRV